LFDAPGGDLFDWEAHNGRLLLIAPHAIERGIKTRFGDSDAIRADIVALAEPGTGPVVEVRDTLIFPKVIQTRVRGQIGTGRMTLGRLGQGDPEQGNRPWILTDPTEHDKVTAREFLRGRTSGGQSTTTRPTTAPPAAAPPF